MAYPNRGPLHRAHQEPAVTHFRAPVTQDEDPRAQRAVSAPPIAAARPGSTTGWFQVAGNVRPQKPQARPIGANNPTVRSIYRH